MPFVYCFHSKQEADTYTTSGTPNTEINVWSAQNNPSGRLCTLQAVSVQGKAIGLTALNALGFRLKRWTTPPATGTFHVPSAVDDLAPASRSTVLLGTGGGTAAVTGGAGGPTIIGGFGCLASEPGGWVATDGDGDLVASGAGRGIDFFSVSGTPLLDYEFSGEILEL